MRIHIVGGSGSGTTTLGAALATRLTAAHFDVDDYYWLPSDPSFELTRPEQARRELLLGDLRTESSWVLSGSLVSWGDPIVPLFDLVVFLSIEQNIRMARLAAREVARYGAGAIAPGGKQFAKTRAFLEWARSYEDPEFGGRSRAVHERWLESLPCPVLRLEGDLSTEERITRVMSCVP